MPKYIKDIQKNGGGIGFIGVIQIILIVLKLFGLIHWSWCAVFVPTFLGFGAVVITLLTVLSIVVVELWKGKN